MKLQVFYYVLQTNNLVRNESSNGFSYVLKYKTSCCNARKDNLDHNENARDNLIGL